MPLTSSHRGSVVVSMSLQFLFVNGERGTGPQELAGGVGDAIAIANRPASSALDILRSKRDLD